MGLVSTNFPHAGKSRRGYNVEQVEEFLEDARRAYALDSSVTPLLSAKQIRTTSFAMQKGGYSTVHVDAALERLEDAFATRERERAVAQGGDQAWFTDARATAQQILDRLARPEGQRFDRVNFLSDGYRRKDVDAFSVRLIEYFQNGKPLSVDEVRSIAFRSQKSGYREAQVDLLLDQVVAVVQAVR
jgi:DivIVA domain-containing protein